MQSLLLAVASPQDHVDSLQGKTLGHRAAIVGRLGQRMTVPFKATRALSSTGSLILLGTITRCCEDMFCPPAGYC